MVIHAFFPVYSSGQVIYVLEKTYSSSFCLQLGEKKERLNEI